MSWAEPLAGALLRASLDGALVVALVALLIRALPKLPAGVRCALWWAACLKLVLALAWPAPIELPWLPPPTTAAGPAAAEMPAAHAATHAAAVLPDPSQTAAGDPPATATGAVQAPMPPTPREMAAVLLIALWAGGFGVLAVGAARQLLRLRGALREARPVADPGLERRLATLARRAGVRTPRLLLSESAPSPQVTGLRRPAVLLPAAAARAGGVELDMILSHELAHLRRRDLLFGWVPALAARLFFFHPLAVVAAREYALAREAACDAEALRLADAAPRDYGRLLLAWGVTREGGMLAAVSLGDTHDLKRRLLMLEQNARLCGRRWPLLTLAAVLPVLLLLLPVRLTPAAAAPGTAPDATTHAWSWHDGDGEPVVLLQDDDSVSFNAGTADAERARVERRGDEDLLWFEQEGTAYVIRDAATLERVRRTLQPVFDLAEQQGELGARQGELGGEQGELGGRQGELGAEMGRLGAEMGKLGGELAALVSRQVALELGDGDEAAIAELEAEEEAIEAEMDALGEDMDALGEQMEALGEEQEAMGARQAEMGERQAALGVRQAEASERATAELGRILEQAVRSGKAERVD